MGTSRASSLPILEAFDLVQQYPKLRAVDGVSLSIREGICFGLLGPNGAGKTTTIEMLEGIKKPTSGRILFRGVPIDDAFKQRAGIQFQATALPDYLTVREALKLFGSFYERMVSIEELARECALEEFLDRDSHELSGGQRQRLLLAIALVNDPDLVFLDEPTTGLDPQARRNFWDLVNGIRARGKTILLTTHYMEEAQVLCDEIAIMDRGKIISQGEPKTLLRSHFEGGVVEFARSDAPADLASIPGKIFEKNGLVEIQTTEVNCSVEALLRAGLDFSRVTVRSRNLEDLFLELTGKELRP